MKLCEVSVGLSGFTAGIRTGPTLWYLAQFAATVNFMEVVRLDTVSFLAPFGECISLLSESSARHSYPVSSL